MELKKMLVTVCLAILCMTPRAYSNWQMPTEVIVGAFGAEDSNFGISAGDIEDKFPYLVAVLFNDNIVISDIVKAREMVYSRDGSLIKMVPWYIYQNEKKIENPEYQATHYWNVQGYTVDGNTWMRLKDYVLVDLNGQILKRSTSRPLELGFLKSQSTGTGQYKTTIKYPDLTYVIIANQPIVKYYRDLGKYIYQIETFTDKSNGEEIISYRVHKYNMCNKEVSVLDMPKSEYKPMPPEASNLPTWKPVPIIEYGEPIVSSSGDIYCWARTETQYKILKWTWQDDPNAPPGVPTGPTNLVVASTPTGLSLSWKGSLQDPGCVTDYEIVRSETSGGPFTKISSVSKGIFKYDDATALMDVTYYYKVRALSGKEFSDYSNEAMGKR